VVNRTSDQRAWMARYRSKISRLTLSQRLAANDLTFIELASLKQWRRTNEFASGYYATPSFFCRLVDEVVYWKVSFLSG
jgi:hypothetical protein